MAPQEPSADTVTAAIAALRSDGKKWQAHAAKLKGAQSAAAGLTLTQVEFSKPCEWAGVVEVYQELQQRMVKLLGEGATTLDTMGFALVVAADSYEKDEQNAVHRMQGVW
jgi:hypothetical protein